MKIFTIDSENNLIAHLSSEEAGAGSEADRSLPRKNLSGSLRTGRRRLIELWNSLPGVTPVRKFTNCKTAAARIWKAIRGAL